MNLNELNSFSSEIIGKPMGLIISKGVEGLKFAEMCLKLYTRFGISSFSRSIFA